MADLIYRERLEKKPTSFTRLDEILFTDFDGLQQAQFSQDIWYMDFCNDLDPEELEGTLSFDTVETGEYFSLPLRMCLTNLFQHQIHHRGQTHHICGLGTTSIGCRAVWFGTLTYCEKN